jgi:hypothetical protein
MNNDNTPEAEVRHERFAVMLPPHLRQAIGRDQFGNGKALPTPE